MDCLQFKSPRRNNSNKTAVRYEAPALEKGLDILELLAGAASAMNLSRISEAVGRSRSGNPTTTATS